MRPMFDFDRFKECLRLFSKERREQKPPKVYEEEVFFRTENGMPTRRLHDRMAIDRHSINTSGHTKSRRNNEEVVKKHLRGIFEKEDII